MLRRLLPCLQDPDAPHVRLILTSPVGFTASEEDKVRRRLKRASWGLTSFTVERGMKTIECTFATAKRSEIERLYADIRRGLASDFIGPWTYHISES